MSEENSAGETIGATTTIILEPARISGSTVEPSRREIARKRRKERRLSWALVLGMLVFAVFWLLGMQLVSWKNGSRCPMVYVSSPQSCIGWRYSKIRR